MLTSNRHKAGLFITLIGLVTGTIVILAKLRTFRYNDEGVFFAAIILVAVGLGLLLTGPGKG